MIRRPAGFEDDVAAASWVTRSGYPAIRSRKLSCMQTEHLILSLSSGHISVWCLQNTTHILTHMDMESCVHPPQLQLLSVEMVTRSCC